MATDIGEVGLEIGTASAFLRALMHRSPIGFALFDVEQRYLELNERLAAMNGRPHSDHAGRHLSEIVERDLAQRLTSRMRTVLDRGEPIVDEEVSWRSQDPSGSVVHARVSLYPVRSGREIVGVALLAVDTGTHRRAEDALVVGAVTHALSMSLSRDEILARFARAIVEHMGDVCAVHMREPSGRLRCVTGARAGLEIPVARAIGDLFGDGPDVEHGAGYVLRTGNSDLVREVTPTLLDQVARDPAARADLEELGSRSWIIVPLDVRGKIEGVVSLEWTEPGRAFEIGDLYLLEELARRAGAALENVALYEEAQLANVIKDEFLSIVSHELRTPLSTILGWSKLLSDDPNPTPDRVKKGLDVIQRNAQAQARLVDDILDTSRILRNKIVLDRKLVSLAEPLEEAVELVSTGARARGIEIAVDADPAVTARIDRGRLRQILHNLLQNAVKFTEQGGHVNASVQRDAEGVTIAIADDGAGIDPSFIPHLFSRFGLADVSPTRKHGGLGLGLAISRKLVELHGGSISVESEGLGRGAKFIVRIPDREAGVEAGPASIAPGRSAKTPELVGVRVLLVDDHDDARELYGSVLSLRGARVTLAASAAEARARLAESRFDVLVSDIAMPYEDGVSLVRFAAEQDRAMRRIAISAYTRPEDTKRALTAGFERYLTKPVDTHELASTVAEMATRTSS